MKKMTILSTIASALIFTSSAFSSDDSVKSILDPALETPGRSETEQAFFGGGIDQQRFNRIIDAHIQVYSPIVRQLGASLTVNKLWTDNTENANASKRGSSWIINMYGGLARSSYVSGDGFLTVLCHEQGHLTAGFPAYDRRSDRFGMMGSEGQSDYFATHSCADKLFQAAGFAELDPWDSSYEENAAADFCRKVGGSYCMRKVQGGLSLARWLASKSGAQVSVNTPDRVQVRSTTYNGYPRSAQCRLDTYMAGAACQTPFNDVNYPTNEREMAQQSCNNHTGDASRDREVGARPRCWYAPGT